jgi:hypothetical protein
MQKEQRTCNHCGNPIRGRVDKKFCDDSCRNAFNNQQNSFNTNLIRKINHALRKNRNILAEIIPSGEELGKTSKDKLLLLGFQFKYFTHSYETKKGSQYLFCYDLGYLKLEGDWYLVVKGKE